MNGNTLWIDAINREMEKLKVYFEIFDNASKVLVGHNKASIHLAFDVHMTLEIKAC